MTTIDQLTKDLTCTMCGKVKQTYAEIVYSQGSKVCHDCKKITQPGDNAAFDSYMKSKELPRMM